MELSLEQLDRLMAELRKVPSVTLAAVQQVLSEKIREQSLAAYGRLNDAHELLSSVIGGLLLRVNDKVFEYHHRYQHIDALCATFVIGMPVCKETIERGAYIQALNLLRQEMEILAQIKHVEAGTHVPKKAPDIKVLEETIRRLYGNLSEAAHASTHDVVHMATFTNVKNHYSFPKGTMGIRYFPEFDPLICRRAFAFHVLLLSHIINEMALNFKNRSGESPLTDAETDAMNVAMWLLVEEGMVDRPDPETLEQKSCN